MKLQAIQLRKIAGLIVCALLVLPELAKGQIKETAGDKNNSVTSVVEKDNIRVSVSMLKQNVAATYIPLKVIIRNQQNKKITLESNNPIWWFLDMKKGIFNDTVPLTLYGNSYNHDPLKSEGSFRTMVIEPGQSVSRVINLSRVFDLTFAGKYSVSAKGVFNLTNRLVGRAVTGEKDQQEKPSSKEAISVNGTVVVRDVTVIETRPLMFEVSEPPPSFEVFGGLLQ